MDVGASEDVSASAEIETLGIESPRGMSKEYPGQPILSQASGYKLLVAPKKLRKFKRGGEKDYSQVYLGKGECGFAWLAENPQGQEVCIKVNRNDMTGKKLGLERKDLLKECAKYKLLKDMEVTNVPEYFAHFEGDDVELVMTRIQNGEELMDLSGKLFTEAECMKIIETIAGVLACVHVNRFCHGDPHFGNVMIQFEKKKFSGAYVIDWSRATNRPRAYNKKAKIDAKQFMSICIKVLGMCNAELSANGKNLIAYCQDNCAKSALGMELIYRASPIKCWRKNQHDYWVADYATDASTWAVQEDGHQPTLKLVQNGSEQRIITTARQCSCSLQ